MSITPTDKHGSQDWCRYRQHGVFQEVYNASLGRNDHVWNIHQMVSYDNIM